MGPPLRNQVDNEENAYKKLFMDGHVMTDKIKRKRFNYAIFKRKPFYWVLLIVVLQEIVLKDAFAYIDPGTGSYIFQVMVAAFIGGLFTVKIYWKKIKDFLINFFTQKRVK